MKRLMIMMTICLMLLSTSVTKADLILPVTYRDFESSEYGGHPDFEFQYRSSSLPGNFYSLDSAIVGNTVKQSSSPALLDSDGKPVYTGNTGNGTLGSGTKSTSGKAWFDQWYNDTSASIKITGKTLTFGEISPGMYQYNSSSFFPIDGLGYGNEGESHNYHFTMELHSQFTYVAEDNQIFTFKGDDDVFVYINGKLAIDIGGVHSALEDSISLNTYAANLGLINGSTYDFDLFFAERNTTLSDFKATTNIAFENPVVPVPGALLLALLGIGTTGLKLRRFA